MRRSPRPAAGLVIVAAPFGLFAGRSVYRMEEQGAADAHGCAFSSSIAAIKCNWIFGKELGAFPDVFLARERAAAISRSKPSSAKMSP